MKRLTKRQAEVLIEIARHVAEEGYAPSMREIGAKLAIRSTNAIADHLRALERKGAVRCTPRRSRAVVLLPGWQEMVAGGR